MKRGFDDILVPITVTLICSSFGRFDSCAYSFMSLLCFAHSASGTLVSKGDCEVQIALVLFHGLQIILNDFTRHWMTLSYVCLLKILWPLRIVQVAQTDVPHVVRVISSCMILNLFKLISMLCLIGSRMLQIDKPAFLVNGFVVLCKMSYFRGHP